MIKETFISPEYHVDNTGIVYGKHNRPLKPCINQNGYPMVLLMVDHKRVNIAVHTLVAHAFVDGYSTDKQVNHIDGNKQNNVASNLEWVTPHENMMHAVHTLNLYKGEKNPWAKPVRLTSQTKTLTFPSIADALRFILNTDNSHIIAKKQPSATYALKHKNIFCGYRWEYI